VLAVFVNGVTLGTSLLKNSSAAGTLNSKQSLELDANTVIQLQYEGVKTIDVSPVENVLKEMASYNKPPLQTLSYAWSGPDTVIAWLP